MGKEPLYTKCLFLVQGQGEKSRDSAFMLFLQRKKIKLEITSILTLDLGRENSGANVCNCSKFLTKKDTVFIICL